ncbi:MAG: hypothetical protein P8J20_19630 [Novosphingobium sp.]|nr:hypothetical protein [Novosphingobium sp.]
MAALVLALCLIVFMGLRVRIGLPALRLPSFSMRITIPKLARPNKEAASEASSELSHRARQLAALRREAAVSLDGPGGPENPVEETMRSLEQAFESFESGRISADTYRSLLLAEKRAAVRRRAGLEASDETEIGRSELPQASAAVDAVEWCLNWIDEFEQLSVSAKSLFNPPELTPMAYS